jgi:hypothetical protein
MRLLRLVSVSCFVVACLTLSSSLLNAQGGGGGAGYRITPDVNTAFVFQKTRMGEMKTYSAMAKTTGEWPADTHSEYSVTASLRQYIGTLQFNPPIIMGHEIAAVTINGITFNGAGQNTADTTWISVPTPPEGGQKYFNRATLKVTGANGGVYYEKTLDGPRSTLNK